MYHKTGLIQTTEDNKLHIKCQSKTVVSISYPSSLMVFFILTKNGSVFFRILIYFIFITQSKVQQFKKLLFPSILIWFSGRVCGFIPLEKIFTQTRSNKSFILVFTRKVTHMGFISNNVCLNNPFQFFCKILFFFFSKRDHLIQNTGTIKSTWVFP